MARRFRNIKITRDLVLFVFGLTGVAYETVVTHVDRPTLLFVFGACIGLPAFLRSDERRAAPPPSPESEPTPPPRKRTPVKKPTKRGTAR